ncbi:MAG: type II toxin-antitoxin system MqsR family toxin [Gemmatimonadota bacterium]
MPRWLPRVLRRVRGLAAAGRLRFTEKALAEMAAFGLARDDVVQILTGLRSAGAPTRMRSSQGPEWMYEFRPRAVGLLLYLKVVLRHDVVVVSCHEDQAQEGPDGAA